ncbi:MAG: sulfotransferase [Bacteroidales bacterium]|nr:sulfotransferase [Bacteroidales bacterium]
MKQVFDNKPYIILGVHRSGTSLMSRIFEKTGIFTGKNQNINNEAKFFFQLNNQTLKANNSTAYNFDTFLRKTQNENFLNEQAQRLKILVDKKIKSQFFGIRKVLKHQFTKEKIKWGFKDPRTVLLLPIWQKIFPEAKLLIIFRNPVDVCMSIYYFEQKRFLIKLKKRPNLKFEMQLEEAFKVWKSFTEILYATSKNNTHNTLIVRYEDLHKKEVIQKIIKFTESKIEEKEISEMIKSKTSNYEKPEGYNRLLEIVRNDNLVQKIYPDLEF